jgi:hypothetical protein
MATGEAQGAMLFDFDGVLIGRVRSGAMGFAGIPVTGADCRALVRLEGE